MNQRYTMFQRAGVFYYEDHHMLGFGIAGCQSLRKQPAHLQADSRQTEKLCGVVPVFLQGSVEI